MNSLHAFVRDAAVSNAELISLLVSSLEESDVTATKYPTARNSTGKKTIFAGSQILFFHTYIHTRIHTTCILHTYIHNYYIHTTYMHTYIHTSIYIHSFIHICTSYTHTYIHTYICTIIFIFKHFYKFSENVLKCTYAYFCRWGESQYYMHGITQCVT